MDKGNGEIEAASWTDAVADFKAAVDISANPDSKAALAKAEAGKLDAENHTAADKALAISKSRADDGDNIGAYEILADLNDAQRALVKDQMAALQDAYIQAATAKAKELQLAHTPIRGRVDEDSVRLAYAYMQRAGKLSDDPEIALKIEVMADTISKYYVDLATKYLAKPLSSGVGIGWAFLNEASVYRPNMDAVRDAMTSTNAAYQMRARLSIGVLFRDQTSRRDSAGFADQLQQASRAPASPSASSFPEPAAASIPTSSSSAKSSSTAPSVTPRRKPFSRNTAAVPARFPTPPGTRPTRSTKALCSICKKRREPSPPPRPRPTRKPLKTRTRSSPRFSRPCRMPAQR
jgi:hypothetical protein